MSVTTDYNTFTLYVQKCTRQKYFTGVNVGLWRGGRLINELHCGLKCIKKQANRLRRFKDIDSLSLWPTFLAHPVDDLVLADHSPT